MAESVAELAAIFGYEPAEEPEVETLEEPAKPVAEGESSGEGKDQPSPIATGKESTGEAATEPETEIGEDESRDERYTELLGKLKRFERFAPIIEMLEEEPKLGRQILAQRMGLTPEVEEREVPDQRKPAAMSAEDVKRYWAQRMEQDPLGGLAEFINATVQQATAPTKAVGLRAAVRDFKAGRREDPLFKHYEPILDELIRKSNPEDIARDPDNTLEALETLAFGAWARHQRAAMAKATADREPVTKEKPRALATSRAAPSGGGAVPKKARTPEETYLADKYGEEGLDEEESESAWGR